MKLKSFLLMMPAAPFILIIRGHLGARLTVGLLLATLAAAVAVGETLRHFSRLYTGEPWLEHLRTFAHVFDTLAEPAMVLGLLHLVAALLTRLIDGDRLPDPGSIGSLIGWPISALSLLIDAARCLALWQMLGPGSRAAHRFVRWDDSVLLALLVMLCASGALLRWAHREGDCVPAWSDPLFGRSTQLWRFSAQLVAGARRSRDSLGAIFSRRPKDLRAIQQRSAARA